MSQIEHHLFPQVCTANLVRLVPTVKATCEEFGVHVSDA
jgi:fatty acid desaturase